MADAYSSVLAEVRKFARNMRNDEAAIRGALDHPWSQGQAHRLELVKRAMYERAKFDLLRQRVLHAV